MLTVTNMWPGPKAPAYGVFVASQVKSVCRAGAEVRVYFVNGRESRVAYFRAALAMLALNFRARQYDLVHAHTGHCGALACLQRKYPVLVSYVGYDLYGKPTATGSITLKSRVEAYGFRQLSRAAAATITKSAELECLLPKRVRKRNTIIPNGVDRKLFAPEPRASARCRLGWPEDERAVLFVGDPAVARKRFALARDACQIAAQREPAIRLRVCRGLEQEKVPVWMNAADVLILTSAAEGSPNVVKEALACNLPVVSVDVGDVREITSGVERCLVVPRLAGPASLADALLEVLAEAPARNDGRAKTRHLDADAVAIRLLDLYLAVTAR